MKIESSNIVMYSSTKSLKQYDKKESLRMWIGDIRPDSEGRGRREGPGPAVKLDISALPVQNQPAQAMQKYDSNYDALSPDDRVKVLIIEAMLKALTGKDIKIALPKIPGQNVESASVPSQGPQRERQGWGLEYSLRESYTEREKMVFEAEGTIKTRDGKDITFSARLAMSREFTRENNIELRAGDAKKIDPLVINFDGAATQLTTEKFDFDLDADGRKESISFVRPGSGFLALDRDGDGSINSGSELFGPLTGNGFAELARYDEDDNNWIDESDPMYGRLRVWSRDPQGGDKLFSLADKDIGALGLGSIDTLFTMKSGENKAQGEVKKAGVYLNENGSAGTMLQVDLMA